MSSGAGRALAAVGCAWLRPLTSEDWPLVSAVPELGAALPPSNQRQVQELAGEWRRLFVRNVPPVEEVFLGVGDGPAGRAAAWWDRASVPEAKAHAPDGVAPSSRWDGHIAHQLLALAVLETAGVPDGHDRGLARRLAAWVPPLAWSLHRIAPRPFYAVLVELTLDEILSRLDEGPQSAAAVLRLGQAAAGAVDPRRDLLDASRSGCHISGAELERIAQWLGITGLSGGRLEWLDGLLDASAAGGHTRRLIVGLEDLIDDARLDYDGLTAAYPAWEPYRRIWSQRLDHGATCVSLLADQRSGRSD